MILGSVQTKPKKRVLDQSQMHKNETLGQVQELTKKWFWDRHVTYHDVLILTDTKNSVADGVSPGGGANSPVVVKPAPLNYFLSRQVWRPWADWSRKLQVIKSDGRIQISYKLILYYSILFSRNIVQIE